jgi:6-phosphogluconolactonase
MFSIIRPSNPNNNLRQQCRWHGYYTTSALEQAAVQTILDTAQLAIKERKAFHLVLAGGNTPRHVYELLRGKIADWSDWHIYFGDERCLPIDHAERNSQMAAQAWLNHVSIPASQIHIIPAERGAETAAHSYAQILGKIELFDLVLLGLGEDGHTASLFPGHDWGTSSDSTSTFAVNDAPKPPSQRVSLSALRLSQTRKLMFLVTGAGKRQAVKDWRNGVDIPAAAITPDNGVDIYLEDALL